MTHRGGRCSLGRRAGSSGLDDFARRMPENLGDAQDHDSLDQAGADERGLVAVLLNGPRDDRNEECRTAAEPSRKNSRSETPALLEPLERGTNRSAVDERGANTRRRIECVK